MPTTNPVPSQDPSDLLFNAGKLDEVLNGTGTSFTDRLGTARRTVAGMNSDFDAQLADAESDLNVYRADAAASAAQALGYLNTIRTTSYGAYASDPAADPLGNPPNVGDEYFNTTSNLLKRFNGTTWQASDINTANLAAPSGSSLVGYDTGTVQDVLDAVTGPNGAASVGYTPAGTGAVPTNVQEVLRRPGIRVRDEGALGNGTDNDLPAMKKARAKAGAMNVPLIFEQGRYGVNDIFIYSEDECTVVIFEPGAEIVLLSNTTVGGCTAAQGTNTPTKPLYVFNATVDCANFQGENGIGATHSIGSTFYNPKVKNVLHSSASYGGKAIQWEGGVTTNSKVYNPEIENCTIGIDIGVQTGVKTVGIKVFDVSMRNVDVPIHINDTTTFTPSNSRDQIEILIDGVSLRNCGRLTYPGASSPIGGGIIVQERGFGATVRNLQIVNDRGGYGSAAYGAIGALVRGQGKGLILENVTVDADMTAIFDYNPATFQSPYGGDLASYVLADKIRHFGALEHIIKCMPGGNKMGPGIMRGVEFGSLLAPFVYFSDSNAAAYSNTYLEVINRDNGFLSSGLKSLARLAALGNTPGGNTQGIPAPAQMQGAWTPVDSSGAGLVFAASEGWWFRQGDMVVAMGQVTYPTTANTTSAKLGGLPFALKNNLHARGGGVLTISTVSGVSRIYPEAGTTVFPLLSATSTPVTNATCSGGIFAFMITYPAA